MKTKESDVVVVHQVEETRIIPKEGVCDEWGRQSLKE
jgi:hypothetical protein